MVWYSHLFQNFPQFIVIHTVKGIGVVNKAKIDVFLGVVEVKLLSRVRLFVTPWTAAHWAPLSMGFSRSGNHWSGVPLPSPVIVSRPS